MSALLILLVGGCLVAIVAFIAREAGRHPLDQRKRVAHTGSDGGASFAYGDSGAADCGSADAGGGCDGGGGGD